MMIQRWLPVILTAFLACATLSAQKVDQSKHVVVTTKVELKAEPASSRFELGSPIEIHIVLRNVSEGPVPFVRFGPVFDYRIVIRDGNGKEPPKTQAGQGLFSSHNPISSGVFAIDPGMERHEALNIAELFDLAPGSYEASLSRGLWIENTEVALHTDERVVSNRFTFTVVNPPDLDTNLRDLSSTDLTTRVKALSRLLQPYPGDVWASGLVRDNPSQSQRISLDLIAALEREGKEIAWMEDRGQPVGEDRTRYWRSLGAAAISLRDVRAVPALLLAGGPQGDALRRFAELCPGAVNPILEMSRRPSRTRPGVLLADHRTKAVELLGVCLTRIEAMRSEPEALARTTQELLTALDDYYPLLRKAAAEALRPVANHPQVRAKLESMALADPFTIAMPDGGTQFPVRDAARLSLINTGDR